MRLEEFEKKLQKGKKYKESEKEVEKDLAFWVGLEVEEARIARGLSQKELAKRMNTHQPAIARVESGSYLPSLSFLKRVAEALETHLAPPRFVFLEGGRGEVIEEPVDTENAKPMLFWRGDDSSLIAWGHPLQGNSLHISDDSDNVSEATKQIAHVTN